MQIVCDLSRKISWASNADTRTIQVRFQAWALGRVRWDRGISGDFQVVPRMFAGGIKRYWLCAPMALCLPPIQTSLVVPKWSISEVHGACTHLNNIF